jgi:hypothetical protein
MDPVETPVIPPLLLTKMLSLSKPFTWSVSVHSPAALGEAGPGRLQDGQDLAGELLPFGLGQSQDLPGERPDSNGVHPAPSPLKVALAWHRPTKQTARGLALRNSRTAVASNPFLSAEYAPVVDRQRK